jgi:sigma-B regulation protein RsbU (phosphoserine phosphatase)
MNRLLYRSTARNSFASFFYACFEADTRRLVYVNAGHNPPLLVRAGGNGGVAALSARRARELEGGVAVEAPVVDSTVVELLRAGGIVLGATENASYQQQTTRLEPGDVLVAYTDGVTEAWNDRDEEFGEDRLAEVVMAAGHLPAEGIAAAVVRAVGAFAGATPPHDDVTLVVAKVR